MLTHLNPSPRAPSRIILVGANGFVGKALGENLAAAGSKVVLAGRPSLDLLDPECVAQLAALWGPGDAVIMTAALTPDRGRDTATLIKNLRMTQHLAAAIESRPCAHLVYFSSDAVYDPGSTEVSEETSAAPGDLYGVMHLARELALRETAARAKVPFCALRPCAIYGAGDTHNSYGPNRFIRSALSEGRIRIFGAGEETRDHVHIDDVCELARLAVFHRSTGTLNLVSGEPVTFARVAAEVARLAGQPVAIEQLPRSGPPTHRRFDAAALSKSFPGHKPTSLADGLARTIAVARKAGKPSG